MIVLAVALTFNLSDIIQRDIPNYTQAVGNSLEKGAAAAPKGGSGGVSLQDCQTAALYGGSGLEQCGAAPAFSGIQQWLNTPGGKPLSLASLKGKVVLVDFWAYSCINCQRELPHVEAWYKDYAADGLEVVGVHTPEYAFEHVPSNVAAGVQRLGLTFPVALDNSYDTWNAYDNQSWPAAYLIDATGQIRHVSIGEGDYSGEEQLIRQLLTAAHPGLALPKATDVPDTTPTDADADAGDLPRRRARSRATAAAPPTRPASSRSPPPSRRTPTACPAPGPSASSRSPRARAPGSSSPSTPRTSTSTSAAPARSPSPPAARARSSASPAPRTSTPSPPSSPRRTAP